MKVWFLLNFLIEFINSYNNLSCTNDINDVESSLEQIEIINKICLNRLRVSGFQKSAAYFISNYSGVEVQNGMVNNNEIDVSRLSRNLYFISFIEGADLVMRRFYKR